MMAILVVNCGSTSIKLVVVDPSDGKRIAQLKVERLGSTNTTAQLNGRVLDQCPSSHKRAISELLPRLLSALPSQVSINAVGHRVVHGGTKFTQPTVIDDNHLSMIEEIECLAPLHTPTNLAGIRAARELLPEIKHVAVFDTAFHSTIGPRASSYAIPQELSKAHHIRRFGFHGTSHQYVATVAAQFLERDIRQLRLITCHLGGGCSVCAIENGRSVETSMGMTPLEGLVMGTRSGDIDPGALMQLMRYENLDVDGLDQLLNRESGLLGLSGIGSDFRDIETAAEEGNEACRLALQVFCHRVRKYIGAYAAVMGGVDAIVFTAGIGQNSAVARHRICQRLSFLGAELDEQLNRKAQVNADCPAYRISNDTSETSLLVVATDEARAIAQVCDNLLHGGERSSSISRQKTNTEREKNRFVDSKQADCSIPVAISARHLHLTQETVEQLFGEGHQLTPLKPLSQPGQFAAKEQVTLIGPKRKIERVRVLGPTRSVNQVEISRTDEFFLGIDAPIRASGDVNNSPGITLVGTENRFVTLKQGVICAWRHIHMTPQDAERFGVSDRDVVEVEVGSPGVRSLTFGDVLVRVKPTYKLEMHIDTDEGNAAELNRQDTGELESTDGIARVKNKPQSLAT